MKNITNYISEARLSSSDWHIWNDIAVTPGLIEGGDNCILVNASLMKLKDIDFTDELENVVRAICPNADTTNLNTTAEGFKADYGDLDDDDMVIIAVTKSGDAAWYTFGNGGAYVVTD